MRVSRSSVAVTSLALFLGATLPGCKDKQDPLSGELIQKSSQTTPQPVTTPAPKDPATSNTPASEHKPTLKERGRDLLDKAKEKVADAKEASKEKMADLAQRVGDRAGIGDELRRVVAISDQELAEYGKKIAFDMDSSNTIVGLQDPRAIRLSQIVSAHGGEDGLTSVKLYEARTINAFSLPDGSVRFYTGLLDNLTDEQLRAVLGHEIGHIAEGHAKDRMRVALMTKAGGKLLLDETSGLGDTIIVLLGQAYVNAAYSRSNELEADAYAFKFMEKHKYDPTALREVMKVFETLEKKYGRGLFTIFASHPAAKDRLKEIDKKLDK